MPENDPSKIRSDYHARVRQDIMPMVRKTGGTLLDLGGGIGATAVHIKSTGCVDRAGVVDLVPQENAISGLDFHYSGNLEEFGTLDSVVAAEGPFSMILCLDVLEHLIDPWAIVGRLDDALAPGGVIIASIPNMRYYQASFPLFFRGRWELEDAGIRDRTHLRWFVRHSAIHLMTSSGLALEEIVGHPGGGGKVQLFRAATFGLFNDFTNLQYLIRVRKNSAS